MRRTPTIIEFCTDPQLLDLKLSPAQEALLRAIYGLPFRDAEQEALYRRCTGREEPPPSEGFREVTVVAGARSGKDSRIAAPVALYEAVFGGHARHLDPGERGMIPLVAQDRRAAGIAFGFIEAYATGSPLLRSRVEEVRAREIDLAGGFTVATFPCTLRSLRGWSIPVGVLDELGFYRLEGQADADVEVQASLRRGQVGFPGAKIVKVSTPYMKSGVLWDDFTEYHGREDPDVLVWQAPTRLMNPSVPEEALERERRLDPERFAREYEATFTDDLSAFLPFAWIRGAVEEGRRELPPREGVPYVAAVDPSGGGADAFALAICHAEGAAPDAPVVEDVLRSWRRRSGGKSPDLRGVVSEVAAVCRRYGVSWVLGDRYAAGWVAQAFEEEGVEYVPSPWSKSEAYVEALPLFSQGRLRLLDRERQTRELQALERRARSGGRDRVDHPPGGHDDHANVLALAALTAVEHARTGPGTEPEEEVHPAGRRGGGLDGFFGGIPPEEIAGGGFLVV